MLAFLFFHNWFRHWTAETWALVIVPVLALAGWVTALRAGRHDLRQAGVVNPIFLKAARIHMSAPGNFNYRGGNAVFPQLPEHWDRANIRWASLRCHNLTDFGINIYSPTRLRVGFRQTTEFFVAPIINLEDKTDDAGNIIYGPQATPIYLWRKSWKRTRVRIAGTWETDLNDKVRMHDWFQTKQVDFNAVTSPTPIPDTSASPFGEAG